MNLFYHPDARKGSAIVLEPAEALHITKVFRKKTGDTIRITDGKGNLCEAEIEIKGKETWANIIAAEHFEQRVPQLEVAIAPPKNNERTEWFIEKAVEIGIGKITLIHCDHSERSHIKPGRLQKVAISAMKQSLKLYLPEITDIIPFEEWLKHNRADIKCLAHCYEDAGKKLLQHTIEKGKSVSVAIGPEGDFSKEETEQAIKKYGFCAVSLGTSRLRTETAALAAVHTFELVNQ